MKKTVSLMLALVLMCTTLFGLTSCGGAEGDFDALNAQIAELTKQIDEANSKIATLEAEKAAQTAEITELKAEVKVLEGEKNALVANANALEAEKALLEEKIATLEAEKVAQTAEITELKAEVKVLEGEKNALAANANALEAEIERLKALMDGNSNAILEEIHELEAEKNALIEEVTDLRAENQALRNCLAGIHTKTTATDKKDGTHSYPCGICGTAVVENHNYVNDICTVCGGMQRGHGEYEYIYFGEYPQSLKTADVTITETTDSRGYYLGSDGCYYAKVTARPKGTNYSFANGETITNNGVYYFKVEPIRWRILFEENGEAFLLCDSIIANMAYQSSYYTIGNFDYTTANGAPEGTFANNYEYSEVRAWLNNAFYENAFSALEQSAILTTTVDNSVASTGYTDNLCACNDTEDKVFLLSYAEATSVGYGFSSSPSNDEARYMVTSDYSRATGAYMSPFSSTYGNGYWWLRSPDDVYTLNAFRVSNSGPVSDYFVHRTEYGVVPALRIRL